MIKDIYIISGPAGCNKTLLSRRLSDFLKLDHVSWGNIYRSLSDNEKENILKSKKRSFLISKYIESQIISFIYKKNNFNKGIVLDGYPRNTKEAKRLISFLGKNKFKIKGFIKLNSSLSFIKYRIKNTLYCYNCGRSYTKDDISFKSKKCLYDNSLLRKSETTESRMVSDFYSYLNDSKNLFNIVGKKSESYFSISDNGDDADMFSNTIFKLKNKIKESMNVYEKQSSSVLPTKFGTFNIDVYQSKIDYQYHILLSMGEVSGERNVLTRIHSSCITGDILGSLKCDCGRQLEESLRIISKNKKGLLLYLFQEGRGINIVNKIMAYDLQRTGFDTVEANEELGFPAELRQYDMVKKMIEDSGVKSICLLTNNPDKINKLTDLGVIIDSVCSIEITPVKQNKKYLKTKKEKMGHLLKEFI